jgi:ATP-dependent Clp protease adaptor protein ClpS
MTVLTTQKWVVMANINASLAWLLCSERALEGLISLDVLATAASHQVGHPKTDDGGGSTQTEIVLSLLEPPPFYQVVLLNDDFTPMEFVVYILQQFFHLDIETSTIIMLKIHHEGRGICGVYSRDVAATKVDQVNLASKNAGHPLQCIMEAV